MNPNIMKKITPYLPNSQNTDAFVILNIISRVNEHSIASTDLCWNYRIWIGGECRARWITRDKRYKKN